MAVLCSPALLPLCALPSQPPLSARNRRLPILQTNTSGWKTQTATRHGVVKAENARSAKILEADPRFATWQEEALKVSEDPNRLPMPDLRGNDVYNFWNDEKNVRGLLRKTTIADYANPNPHWQTVLDIDALGKAETRAGSITAPRASIRTTSIACSIFPWAAKTQPPRASST